MIALQIHSREIGTRLEEILNRVERPEALLKIMGRRGANELKTHFRARNRTPNKLGGRRTNFWRAVADRVNSPIQTGNGVRIVISHPHFAQRLYGGTIRPKRAKALTIPVDPMAYERTTKVFQRTTGIQLFLLRKKGGGMSRLLAGIVGENKIQVFYILAKSVTQKADPEALPPQDQFSTALLEEAVSYIKRQVGF